MKRNLKKISVVFIIVSIFISCFVFQASAETVITEADQRTFKVDRLESLDVLYNYTYPFYENVKIPSQTFTSSVTANDLSADSFSLRLWLNSGLPEDFQIIVPAGYTLQMGLSSTMLRKDSENSNKGIVTSDDLYNKKFCKATLYDSSVGIHGGMSMDISFSVIDSENGNPFYTGFVCSWTNNSGISMGLNTMEFGFEKTNALPEYYYYANIRSLTYRVLSPDEVANDEIMNGWTPNPEKPEGSDKVDQMEGLEDQIMGDVQDGVTQGESLISSLGASLSEFTSAFIFISGLFNLSMNVGWIPALLQISLALGIIAFLLNVLPGAVSSFMNRRDAEKRRNERQSKGNKGG